MRLGGRWKGSSSGVAEDRQRSGLRAEEGGKEELGPVQTPGHLAADAAP